MSTDTKGKVSKVFAHYQWHPHDHKACGGCTMFREPRACTKVEGVISKVGFCRFFFAIKQAHSGGVTLDSHHRTIGKDLAAAEAATNRNPTEAEKASGTYAKGKFTWHGATIAVETPKGATRSGKSKDGHEWQVTMPASYGYLLKSEASDGDHVDVYIGKDHASQKVWVIDQVNADTRAYDEPKAFLDFPSRHAALSCYRLAFSDGRGSERIGHVTEMSIPKFLAWAKSPAAKKPLRKPRAMGGANIPALQMAAPLAMARKYRGH